MLDRLATPLGGLLAAAAQPGGLAGAGPLALAPGAAVTVVIAAEGYPGHPARGDEITGLTRRRPSPAPTSCTRAPTLTGGGTWSRPAAGCSTWSAPARTWPPPATPRTGRPAGS